MFNKKGQLKIKQMSFMLLALVLLFIIVGLFFITFSYSGLKKEVSELRQREAISTALRLAGTPEFSCGREYCIDTDKVIALKNIDSYREFWQVESIEIRKINGNTICSLSNYPNCNVFEVMKKSEENVVYIDTFVVLCRKDNKEDYVYDKCELGKLLIGYKKEF